MNRQAENDERAPLIAALASDEPRRRRAALERLAMAEDAPTGVVLDGVIACLAVPERVVQRLAAEVLERVEAQGRSALIDRLRDAMVGNDPHGRWGAVYALGRLGLADRTMIPPLVDALGGDDGDRRWAAATLLAACARAATEIAIPALVDAAADPDHARRKMALYVLRDAAPTHPETRRLAVHGLDDPAVGVRFAALAALARIRPVAAEACARVVVLASTDADDGVRRAALCTLGAIGRGVSVAEDAIAAAEASDDPLWRRAAAIARRRLVA